MKYMNTTAAPTSKTSFAGFVRFLAAGSKRVLIGEILLAVVVVPAAILYDALVWPTRAFYPVVEEPGYLTALATRSWTRYKESLLK